MKSQNTQAVVTWRGFAFENVCFMHLHQIKRALGISDVQTTSSAWTQRDSEANGTQIDLVIDREDNVVNACEIKFYKGPFTVNKAYAFSLMNRLNLLTDQIPSRKVVRQVLITTYGLNRNEYSDLFSNVITADDLFE